MKSPAKSLMQQLALIPVLPLAMLDLLPRALGSEGLFVAFGQLLSLLPGKSGSYLRVAFFRMTMQHCARDCFIGFATLFAQRATHVGRGVYIGPQCNIGACRIDDDVLIASGVHIMSGTNQHYFSDLQTPIRDQGGEYRPVRVGRDSWIGNGVMVMADIGEQCVIGAGSVVTQAIPDRSVAVGNPARVIRSRRADDRAGTEASLGHGA